MAFTEPFGSVDRADILGLPLGSGASSGLFVHYAANAIRSGQCDVVLAVSADNLLSGLARSGAVKALADNRDKEFEAPYGPGAAGLLRARRAAAHVRVRARLEQRLSVAVTMRRHASMNPRAHQRDSIAVADGWRRGRSRPRSRS